MPAAESKRRLTTILAADVVGYSRLMAAAEEATLGTLRAYRTVFGELVDKHGGRIVNTVGDAILAEFGSTVEAVRSAISIQEDIAVRNAELPDDRRMWFRIGINVGDVIAEDGDIFGDGVNVAARLEALADKGGVCISGSAFEQVRNKLSIGFTDIGLQSVKNIPEPVRVFRATPRNISATADGDTPDVEAEASAEAAPALPLPNKPSIAVLPFDNLSGDPEQEYFADGLAEDIITGLSKFHWFFVIARNSSFTYKGRAVDVKQVGRELGVRYVLEGSVRKAGNRVRISAQLIDATAGSHVWADRYDRELDDIFELQDELTEAIVTAVAPSFISAEARRVETKRPENFDAWDCAMRGNWHLGRRNKTDVAEARRLFERALELSPRSTMALTGLAFTVGFSVNFQWVDDLDEARRFGNDVAQRAVDSDQNDAEAHVALALIKFYSNQLDAAVTACRNALELNPNSAAAEGFLAILLSWRGDYGEAIVHAERSSRLSPRDNYSTWSVSQIAANFGAGRYEQCVDWARKMIDVAPEWPVAWRYLTASLSHLGRMEEAQEAKDELLRVMPHENLRLVRAALPSANVDRMERFVDGLRKAGVPE